MKNLRKFKKSEVLNLMNFKGGSIIGGKTRTEPSKTVEFQNDIDPNAGIEAANSWLAIE